MGLRFFNTIVALLEVPRHACGDRPVFFFGGACATWPVVAAPSKKSGKSETMSNSPGLSAVSTVSPLSDAIEAAALAAALAESELGSS
jgi:hypothetical protein